MIIVHDVRRGWEPRLKKCLVVDCTYIGIVCMYMYLHICTSNTFVAEIAEIADLTCS